MLSDYDCRVLDVDRYKLHLGNDSLLNDEFQKIANDVTDLGSLGFHKLVCQVKCSSAFPVSNIKKSISAAKRTITKEISHRLSGKFSLSFIPVLYLSKDVPYIKDLKALSVSKSNYIFIELPFSFSSEHVPMAINKILYSQKLIPVFANFHAYTSTYDSEEINRFIGIKNAAFQFSLSHAILPQNVKIIKKILKSDNTVLLGTACDHSDLNKLQIAKNIKALQGLLGEEDYIKLILKARAFPS